MPASRTLIEALRRTRPGKQRGRRRTQEQHDGWKARDRRYFSEASMLELATMTTAVPTLEEANIIPQLTAA